MSSIYHPAGLTILSHRLEHLSKGMSIHGIAGSIGLAVVHFSQVFLPNLVLEICFWDLDDRSIFLSGATILLIPDRFKLLIAELTYQKKMIFTLWLCTIS
ncbi:MAG: hypothetical protein Ct9H300mP2_5050 [Candidatus Neomarinimicrobiota bacterium]|nr:MAG: hypothetical protein Ct9H300mP2_5050 [Candidatus Neomarinimicrobiota bacterium]